MERPIEVLLADDEPAVALAVKSVLKFCGYGVQLAGTGEAALARVRDEPGRFALVVSDHNMPGMSGLELAKGLRGIAFAGKILILSAFVSSEMEAAYEKVGVCGIVQKPFDLRAFRAAVESAIGFPS